VHGKVGRVTDYKAVRDYADKQGVKCYLLEDAGLLFKYTQPERYLKLLNDGQELRT